MAEPGRDGTDQNAGPDQQMDHVVVIGGGTMGAGIAQSLLQAGNRVTLIEVDDRAAQHSRDRVRTGLRRHYRKADHPDKAVASDLAALTVTADYLADDSVGLVIEAVPERPEVKSAVLERASRCWASAVIATNTSSLSLAKLADAVYRPERFVGTHFFNPVHSSAMVEIVVAPATSPAAVRAARDLAVLLGKDTIEVRDVPGFATSRLGLALGLEAIRMVEEGVASVQDIDKGMRLGYRFPMGPLELTDLVGLDVRLSVAEYLAQSLGSRFEPPALLREKVGRGELGSKTGQGFYTWKKNSHY
jgi:3-hydroxybutyryl-CoA dehydrogenase